MPLVIDIVTAITDKVSKGSEQELATPILAVVNIQLGQVTQLPVMVRAHIYLEVIRQLSFAVPI